MKHKKFQVAKDGEWIQPMKRGYLMACCDCGLVHRMNFRIADGRVQFQAFRAQRYTMAQRKKERTKVTK